MSTWYWYEDGSERPDTSGMSWPMRCIRCGHVHDAGKVTVIGRYSDCSVWRCPGCGSAIDDRPVRWGGSAEKVERRPDVGNTTLAFILTLATLCAVAWFAVPNVPGVVEAMTVGVLRILGYAVVGCVVAAASVAVLCVCVRSEA